MPTSSPPADGPMPPRTDAEERNLERLLPAWGLAAGPLCVQLLRLEWFGTWVVVWVAATTLAGLLIAQRRPLAGVAFAGLNAVAVFAIGFFDPKMVVLLSTMGTALAGTGTGVVRIHPTAGLRGPRVARPSIVLIVPLLAADVLLVAASGIALPAVVMSAGNFALATAILAPPVWRRVDRATSGATRLATRTFHLLSRGVDRGARAVATAIAVPATAILFAFVVVAPWAGSRVTRSDPMWAPRRRASRWIAREGAEALRTTQLFVDDTGPRRTVAVHRWSRTIPALAAIAVVVVFADEGYRAARSIAASAVGDGPTSVIEASGVLGPDAPAADQQAAQPWFADWVEAYDTLGGTSTLSQYTGMEYPDIRSRHLTYLDGVRRSWEPPPDECRPPVDVWMFGGSTMFGAGQRDGHTIASELARAAHRSGVHLRVQNRGVPGDVSWIEQRRFERALTMTDARPDLVVFYDGFNDLRAVEWAYMAGRDVEGGLWSLNDRDLMLYVTELVEEEVDGETFFVADRIDVNARPADQRAVVDATLFQLAMSREVSERFATDQGIPMVQFLQPWNATRQRLADGDAATSPELRERARRIRDGVPEGVIDLTAALDSSDAAFFTDDIHTNEAANPLIAARMWDHIEPIVTAIVPDPEAPGCS